MISFFRGKTILVTGATGFKGSWLSYLLVRVGARVVGLSFCPHTAPNFYTILGVKNLICHYTADVRDFSKLQKIFRKEKPEIVFHLAAQAIVRASYKHPYETFHTNVMGTQNMLEAIRLSSSVRSAVVITSDKVYKNTESENGYHEEHPLGGYDPYSASKAAADIIAQSYISSYFSDDSSPSLAIARAGNVIGGGDWGADRLIPDIIRALFERRAEPVIRNPDSIRPWQHVLEPLAGYCLLARELQRKPVEYSGAWNFGPDNDGIVTVRTMAQKILSHFNASHSMHFDNPTPLHESRALVLDASKARRNLSWESIMTIDDAARKTAEWYDCYYTDRNAIQLTTDRQIDEYFTAYSPESSK